MAAITEEVAGLEQQQGWEKLFVDIKRSSQYEFSCKAAKLQENRHKNRYRDVSPYDHSRVKLQRGPSDYINSSHVEVAEAGRHYILSQGPLPATSGHLWQMVWEQNSKAVIMLNKIIEKGMRKCDQYWPVDKNYPLSFYDDGYMVTLINETDMQNFVIRELELLRVKDNEARVVYHFHYTAWPDFDVPQSPAAFLNFLACIRQYRVLDNENGPAVIHCSAGIGRSGTFILIDTCLELLQKGIPFEIRKVLLEMRKYRMGLIQTPHQLRFSYFAIAECERIILFKQSEENNGYSDGDGLSEAESEDYDQLCRDDNVVYDIAEEDDSMDPTSNLAELPSEDSDRDVSSTTSAEYPQLERDRAESLSSIIEDDESAETIAQPQTDSKNTSNINGNHTQETSIENNTEVDKRLCLADANNDQEASIKLSKKSDSAENIHVSQPVDDEVNKEFKDEENKEPKDSSDHRTLEQNYDQTKSLASHLPPTLTNAETITENSDFKQNDASITTLVTPESDILRKRVFENNEISDTKSTIKHHEPDDIVNNINDQTSWRPYVIGGLVISAFGAFVTLYSRL